MKRTRINQKANQQLKKIFGLAGIKSCEIKLSGCTGEMFLTYAHRHKRNWYKDKPDKMLWKCVQVVLSCCSCHQKIEIDAELTEKVFLDLRGEEINCNFIECAAGMGVAGNGSCFVGGDYKNPICPKFKDEFEFLKEQKLC